MGYRQNRLYFRRKKHALTVVQQVQRLDADAVAHQVQGIFTRIVNRNSKHAVEFADKADAFALIEPQNNFRVRPSFELHALRTQIVGELNKIEYFTVLHHRYLSIITDKRLVTAANVNNGQAPVTDANAALRLMPNALVVRAAVHQLLRHGVQCGISQRCAVAAPITKNTAHQFPPLPLRRPNVSHMTLKSNQTF